MEITTFIAQFLGYFIAIMGATMLLKRRIVEKGLRDVLRNRGTLYVVGLLEMAAGILLVLAHPSWETTLDKVISALSWFLLIEGVFYILASQKQIISILRFVHREMVYYTIAWASVVAGASLVLVAY